MKIQYSSLKTRDSSLSFGNRTSNIGIGRQSNIPSRTHGISLSNRSSYIGPQGRTTYSRPSGKYSRRKGAADSYVAAAWQRYARVRVRITPDTKRSLVNQNGQYEPLNAHPARNMSRMSTASRTSRMSRLSTMSRQQLPNPARESTSRLSRSSVTSTRRKDITLIAREFPPVTKLGSLW